MEGVVKEVLLGVILCCFSGLKRNRDTPWKEEDVSVDGNMTKGEGMKEKNER